MAYTPDSVPDLTGMTAVVTGANGIIVPPPEYFPRLREICDNWGTLLIADEVMSGFGRTGKWFAVDHWDVVPDIMTMAKGLSGAYVPLGATVVRKHIGDRFKEQFFSHGATYAGHALACAAALAVIPIYQEDNLIENSAKMGKYLLEKALELKDKHPCLGDVRGLGLFVGLELVKNKKTREPIMPLAAKVRPGMNPKLEVAKKLVNIAKLAAKKTAKAAQSGATPSKALVKAAVRSAAQQVMSKSMGKKRSGSRHSGRWVRKGTKIVVLGA